MSHVARNCQRNGVRLWDVVSFSTTCGEPTHFERSMGPMVMAARPPVAQQGGKELALRPPKELERDGTPRGFQAAQVCSPFAVVS